MGKASNRKSPRGKNNIAAVSEVLSYERTAQLQIFENRPVDAGKRLYHTQTRRVSKAFDLARLESYNNWTQCLISPMAEGVKIPYRDLADQVIEQDPRQAQNDEERLWFMACNMATMFQGQRRGVVEFDDDSKDLCYVIMDNLVNDIMPQATKILIDIALEEHETSCALENSLSEIVFFDSEMNELGKMIRRMGRCEWLGRTGQSVMPMPSETLH